MDYKIEYCDEEEEFKPLDRNGEILQNIKKLKIFDIRRKEESFLRLLTEYGIKQCIRK